MYSLKIMGKHARLSSSAKTALRFTTYRLENYEARFQISMQAGMNPLFIHGLQAMTI